MLTPALLWGGSIPDLMAELGLAILVGAVVDALVGDPRRLPHPVVAMGKAIGWLEPRLRRLFPKTGRGEFAAGLVLTIVLTLGSFLLASATLALAGWVHPALRFALEAVMCWQALAGRELARQGTAVEEALEGEGLSAGREALAKIVGRDVDSLDEEGVSKAAVESVAENASDGVVAPLFYLFLGGAPLAMLFKASSTLDSMVGYEDGRYRHFGTASAKLDDALCWIPSRLSALAMIAVAPIVGLSREGAWRIWRRDRRKHESPNAGQGESAMAGALGVRLAGPASYGGELEEKPFLGDALRPVETDDIRRAVSLMGASSGLCFAVFFAVRAIVVAVAV